MCLIQNSSRWLILVECWFRDPYKERICRGVFHSMHEGAPAAEVYIVQPNQEPQLYAWMPTP